TRKTSASTNVALRYRRCLPHSFIFSVAHAITIVTDELIRMIVLIVPSATLNWLCGHSGPPTRSRMYDENSAPNSITSEDRNSQTPNLPLCSPVSGLASTVYGMFIYARSGSNCGVKSFDAPGTLYSYGPRYTIGSVTKFPCPGGDGADHSSVVASQGLRSTAVPALMLIRKFTMNGIRKRPRPQAAKPMTRFHLRTDALCAYCAPPSYLRRFIPARPWMNIGMKTRLMQMNEPQKWILPSGSFIVRPVAFGNQ